VTRQKWTPEVHVFDHAGDDCLPDHGHDATAAAVVGDCCDAYEESVSCHSQGRSAGRKVKSPVAMAQSALGLVVNNELLVPFRALGEFDDLCTDALVDSLFLSFRQAPHAMLALTICA
jgi:hypothetical protein